MRPTTACHDLFANLAVLRVGGQQLRVRVFDSGVVIAAPVAGGRGERLGIRGGPRQRHQAGEAAARLRRRRGRILVLQRDEIALGRREAPLILRRAPEDRPCRDQDDDDDCLSEP
jgi:hypothetical protein